MSGQGKQGMLFDDSGEGAYARRSDPGTSHNAARSIRGKRVTELEGKVYEILKAKGPQTAWEIHLNAESVLGHKMDYGSTSPRLSKLEEKGKVRRLAPERRAGREPSIVWEAIVWKPPTQRGSDA